MSPLETIQTGLNNWLHEAQVYLTGRGIKSGAILVAGVIAGTTNLWLVPMAIALGGVATSLFNRLRNQWSYQDTIADKYRGEIADRLGIAPEAVTREHVKIAAYGNEAEAIDGNPILAQALERQRQKSWLTFGTALVAGLVTFSILMTTGGAVGGWLATLPIIESMPIVANVVGMMSGAIVAGLSSLLVQNGLEMVVGNAKGIATPSAQDRILALEARQARGKTITPEQVFQVKLAVTPELEERVVAMAGKKFSALKADMQERVLARIDTKGEMLMIAEELNKKNIDAKELTFILVGQQTVRPAEVEKADGESTPARTQERKPSFTERLGFKPHREDQSHVESIEEARVVPIEAGRA